MHAPDGVTLDNCDREPIHIPGSIQPHGCILACDVAFQTIRRCSVNAASFLGLAQEDLVGRRTDEVLGAKVAHAICNALMLSHDPARPGLLTSIDIGDASYDIAAHRHKADAIVEFERSDQPESNRPLQLSRTLISSLKGLSYAKDILRRTPNLIRSVLGYDRVMIYRFAHDGAGQVVAEAKRGDLESFLGQHFPASDIPRQARELYLKNTVRVISNASCARIAIEPALDASGEPLDLSFAHLRSVSPIHCEYLSNMGVAASMSISVVVGGKLWGLIACHHYTTRMLSMPERIAAEMFGDYFSLNLEALYQRERLEAALTARRTLDGILREVSYSDNVAAFLQDRVSTFAALMPCDGIGIWINGSWNGYGSVPPPTAVTAVARLVSNVSEGRIWATHQLSSHLPSAAAYASDVSGLLAVPLSQMPRDYLFFFRKEVIETVHWAGDPNKSYKAGEHGDRLTPRKSFEIWKETVERQSVPWTASDRDSAEGARTALLEVLMRQSEILSAERRQADVRQKVLNDELNHRVKNILALIKSLISQSTGQDRTLEDYVASLKGRVMALAFAHDQVVRSDGGGSLHALLDAELGPYRGGARTVELAGPDVVLEARAYSVMALVLHETATNAAKYGALSVDAGALHVTWSLTAEGECDIRWSESGGPVVSPPRRRGFGAVLVERSIPYDLGGESHMDFVPSGLQAHFVIPSKFVSLRKIERRASRSTKRMESDGDAALAGLSILLVEDQLVIALEAESMLSENGAGSIFTAATTAEALRILARETPDIAILDVNLGVGSSIPVARELLTRGVPFVFATGYGDSTQIPADLKGLPIVRKPYDVTTLLNAITDLRHPAPSAGA